MAFTPTDLAQKIRDMIPHVAPLPPEAGTPFVHYERSIKDIWSLLLYFERNFKRLSVQPAALRTHMARLHGMIFVNLVESFERYLKEVAAACVDSLARYVLDDRFNAFHVRGSALAAHFGADTLGRSLCESATWLDCEEINDRFRKLLSDPFQKDGRFHLFPRQNQDPASERWRLETLSIVWQLRHTVVHNVGVITQSDAIKLRLLVRSAVPSMQVLSPTRDDIHFSKRFLDETAEMANSRIGSRLAELLTTIHVGNPALFAPQEMADRITETFGFILTVAGAPGLLPP
jgi:hypothetical protein